MFNKIAIFFGLRKFETYAQANPELPDDTLAVANTVGTYPVRGAAMLILGSLAHAADNLLRGTESIDQFLVHAVVILSGLCIIWVRHAISKHDVQVNTALSNTRVMLGIPPVVKLIIAALAFGLVTAHATPATAQTNGSSQLPTPPGLVMQTIASAPLTPQPVSQFISIIMSNGETHAGITANLHGKYGASLSQQLDLFGFNKTNAWLHIGPQVDTAFLDNKNVVALGPAVSVAWDKAPKILKWVLFNADNVEAQFGVSEPRETWTHPGHADWKATQVNASVGRKF